MPKRPNAGGQRLLERVVEMLTPADEVPPLTDDYFERAAIYEGETLVRPGRGRPKSAAPKRLTSLRLEPEVIAAFRASGPGWQTRINEVLKTYIRSKRRFGGLGVFKTSLEVRSKKPSAAKRRQSA
jgi:uncharacterized protein (DUF4415 family)